MILVDANLLVYGANRALPSTNALEPGSTSISVEQRVAAWIPLPGTRHAEVLGGLLEDSIVTSRLVSDAHLAALAIEHGLTLCSTDGDFSRFCGLK